MSQDFVGECLRALAAVDDSRYAELLRALQPALLDHPHQAAVLVRRITDTPEDDALEPALALLSGALDEARMADGNGQPEGGRCSPQSRTN